MNPKGQMIWTGLISLIGLIAHGGFYLSAQNSGYVLLAVGLCSLVAILIDIHRYRREKQPVQKSAPFRWTPLLSIFFLIWWLISPSSLHSLGVLFVPTMREIDAVILGISLPLAILFMRDFANLMSLRLRNSNITLRPVQVLVISFLLPIFFGTLLLQLPRSSVENLAWIDVLFMATSAVCVTGLSAVDLAVNFTPLGKLILLLLIQIGGLGIITLTVTFATLLSGGIGVRDRIMMSQLLSEDSVGAIKGLLLKICTYTFAIEAMGAVVLYLSSGNSFANFDQAQFYEAVFHAISAFCNAGFGLATLNFATPELSHNYPYIGMIMVLIVLGGLGFPLVSNLWDFSISRVTQRTWKAHVSMTSRMILWGTVVLLPGGMLAIYLVENNHAFSELSFFNQVYHSLFISVTSRTAGFNIFPMETLSAQSAFIIMFLMWVGGGPMSTAGGIKITTLMITLINIKSLITGRSRCEAFGREISQVSLNRAFATVAMSVILLGIAFFGVVYFDPKFAKLDVAFEIVSAFATTGLSRGITAHLSDPSKFILILLMFVGRLGSITILMALFRPPATENYRLLEERVIVY
jgi:trk system potassium uptake protein TrkH